MVTLSTSGFSEEGSGGVMAVLTLSRTDGMAINLARNITVNLGITDGTAGTECRTNNVMSIK